MLRNKTGGKKSDCIFVYGTDNETTKIPTLHLNSLKHLYKVWQFSFLDESFFCLESFSVFKRFFNLYKVICKWIKLLFDMAQVFLKIHFKTFFSIPPPPAPPKKTDKLSSWEESENFHEEEVVFNISYKKASVKESPEIIKKYT